ncbi:unnamed protein product [Brassica oleracea]
MDTVIKEASAKETTDVNQLNMIENEVGINTNWPVRLTEEYL